MGFLDGVMDALNFGLKGAQAAWDIYAQKETWKREDTAVQRKMEDLKEAGLNPLLAAGGPGAPTSSPVNVEAPQAKLENTAMAQALLKQKADISRSAAEQSLLNMQKEVMAKQKDQAQLEIDRKVMDNAIRRHDMDLILKSPVRSDVMSGWTGIVQQAVNALAGLKDKGHLTGPAMESLQKLGGEVRKADSVLKQVGDQYNEKDPAGSAGAMLFKALGLLTENEYQRYDREHKEQYAKPQPKHFP